MAVNVQKYAKRFEELIAKGKSYDEAHAQAAKESETTTGAEPEKKSRMSLGTYLLGAKSSIPKAKADVLKQADKDIQYLQGAKNPATKSVQEATGAESDIDKAIRERAQKARRKLLGMR